MGTLYTYTMYTPRSRYVLLYNLTLRSSTTLLQQILTFLTSLLDSQISLADFPDSREIESLRVYYDANIFALLVSLVIDYIKRII